MKTHHPKLKTPPRPLFSCGLFRDCTQTVLSPTTPHSPPLSLQKSDTPPPPSPSQPPPPPPPPAPPSDPPPRHQDHSSSTSSSSTSQSFTQWRFPLPNSPLLHHPPEGPDPHPQIPQTDPKPESSPQPPPFPSTNLEELFHISELQLTTGSEPEQFAALHLLERSLVPNPQPDPVCPPKLMSGVVSYLKDKAGAKSATKVLLALCLGELNRHVAVEVGAVGAVVEAVVGMDCAAAERALAALELMCTVAEGAAEVRAHALTVPIMVEMMGRLDGWRGKEYAISVLAVVYSGSSGGEMVSVTAPPEEVARAVALALQGECSARGRRKGAQLLKSLKEKDGSDLNQEE